MAPARPKLRPQPIPRQQKLEIYTTSSTGHQVGGGVSKPVSWHKSRQSKVNAQFRAGNTAATTILQAAQAAGAAASDKSLSTAGPKKQVFAGCSVYVSGTTAPLISDHALKHLLVQHGSRVCTILARKGTTHVILGEKATVGAGAGGGLAAGKIAKENAKSVNTNIKYVTVHWALESMKEGRKLAESRFAAGCIRAGGQRDIKGMLVKTATEKEEVK